MTLVEVKTAELEGKALDWAVLAAMEVNGNQSYWKNQVLERPQSYTYRPSTDWSHGGPLIGRELISFSEVCSREKDGRNVTSWLATCRPIHQFQNYTSRNSVFSGEGPTHLIAAMRCLVASKLGEVVMVPEELLP